MSNEDEDLVDGAAVLTQLENLLGRWIRSAMLELRVMAPARVLVYNPALQRASVMLEQLPVKSVEGEPVPQKPIPLPPIPVSFLRGMGGTAYQSIPLAPGDTGMVVFSDRDLSQWARNPATIPVDPISGVLHGLTGGVFIPGLHKDTDVPPPNLDAHLIEGPLVRLGQAGVQFALRGTALAAACNATTPTSIAGVLTAVPAAADPATVITLANANKAAILALCAAIVSSISTKVQIE